MVIKKKKKVSKKIVYLWNITKTYKIKCFRRKYLKISKSRGFGNISPQFSKKYKNRDKKKKREKDKESYKFIVYTIFNIN